MRCALLSLWLGAILMLSGCGWLASFYKEKPGGSDASHVQSVVRGLPYGWIVDAAIGLGSAIVGGGATHAVHKKKHKKSQAEIAALKAKVPAA